jgi:excisionase family DNA binding protein
MNSPERLLTIPETALALNISIKSVRRCIKASEIAVVRVGRSVRIHPKELQRFIVARLDFGPSSPPRAH